MTKSSPPCFGVCRRCQKTHTLQQGEAKAIGSELLATLMHKQRLDLEVDQAQSDPHLSTAYLFGAARGKMFGVLHCVEPGGAPVILKAFSGQYNGRWLVDGWVPPLFDVDQWNRLTVDIDKEIKQLGADITRCGRHSSRGQELFARRRALSRKLMLQIHDLYQLTNFRGETCSLAEAYNTTGGIPNGTGDCCGPKLLGYAARNNLTPRGMAEFYMGRENKIETRHHGHFYTSCAEKCQPILGFLLCGLGEEKNDA